MIYLLFVMGCGQGNRNLDVQPAAPFPSALQEGVPLKLRLNLQGGRGNPFDAHNFEVQLHVTYRDGEQLTQPAFFMADHDVVLSHGREVVRDTGRQGWEIRWTPLRTGDFHWEITATSDGKSAKVAGESTVNTGSLKGFARVSKSDPSYFEFADGTFYYPVGHYARSPGDDRWKASELDNVAANQKYEAEKTFAYESWFAQMSANSENYCSIWMTPWWLGLEWTPKIRGYDGLKQYNQIHAAQLDRIFAAAEKYGIQISLFVTNHGQISTYVDSEWADNPLRKANGGPVEMPSEVVDSPECEDYYQSRLRYVLARWGYSPSLFAVVLCSEVDWIELYQGERSELDAEIPVEDSIAKKHFKVPKKPRAVIDWLARQSTFLKGIDAHQHLTTIQFSKPREGLGAWNRPEFSVVMSNCYEIDYPDVVEHAASQIGFDSAIFGWSKLNSGQSKPKLLAEWGGSHLKNSHARLRGDLCVGLWSMAMTDCAGVTGFWWGNEIDHQALYPHFRAINDFLQGYDRRGQRLVSMEAAVEYQIERPALTLSDGKSTVEFARHPTRSGLVLANDQDLFAYVCHQSATSSLLPTVEMRDRRFEEATESYLQVPNDFAGGNCSLEYWDTFTGHVFERRNISLEAPGGEARRVPLPIEARSAVAIKLRHQN